MLTLALVLAICPSPDAWLAGQRATEAEREQTRAAVRSTCRALGASETACEVLDVVTVRESAGDACAVHVLGPREYGLGPHGLSVRWQLWRWDRDADPDILRDPVVSTVVVLRLWRHALRIGARSWLDLQRIYAGRGELVGEREVSKRGAAWCRRLQRRGIDCRARVTAADLGQTLGVTAYPQQREDLDRALAQPKD